jgi:hypothetical protein
MPVTDIHNGTTVIPLQIVEYHLAPVPQVALQEAHDFVKQFLLLGDPLHTDKVL